MSTDIVTSLATFLEAIPYQVETWDKSVIETLSAHPEQLDDFKKGSPAIKWRIYSSIKYRSDRLAA